MYKFLQNKQTSFYQFHKAAIGFSFKKWQMYYWRYYNGVRWLIYVIAAKKNFLLNFFTLPFKKAKFQKEIALYIS
jgi:hypothetical protein